MLSEILFKMHCDFDTDSLKTNTFKVPGTLLGGGGGTVSQKVSTVLTFMDNMLLKTKISVLLMISIQSKVIPLFQSQVIPLFQSQVKPLYQCPD